MLNEKRVITRIISLTDSVPEGTAHSVILPASLDNVKPMSSSLLVGKKVTERTTSSLCNTMNLYGFTDLYFKLVDASTGKQIKSGITLENSYSYAVQPDGTVKLQLYNDQSGSYTVAVSPYRPAALHRNMSFPTLYRSLYVFP